MKKPSTLATLLVAAAICCLNGCGVKNTNYEMVAELVASKDIPAGSIIDKPVTLFRSGKLFYKNEQPKVGPKFDPLPPGLFPGNWMGMLEGKKVVRNLKKDEVVKIGDIAEADGSTFKQPQE